MVHVPRREIRERPAALVLELVAARTARAGSARSRGGGRVLAAGSSHRPRSRTRPGADACHRTRARRDPAPARPSRRTPDRAVDPALLLPRLDRVLVQPPPDRRRGRLGDRQARSPAGTAQCVRTGPAAARTGPAARTRPPSRRRPAPGGKRRGRPARGLSFNPSRRCIGEPSSPLARQSPPSCPTCAAISVSCNPSAAYSTIRARCTS